MLFRVLGPMEALLGASPIVLGGAQQRALLAILLVHANRPVSTDTLIDLRSLRWPALAASSTGLDIAATCTIAELYGFQPPAEWTAAPLFQLCARAFLASFKIWNAATGRRQYLHVPAGRADGDALR